MATALEFINRVARTQCITIIYSLYVGILRLLSAKVSMKLHH